MADQLELQTISGTTTHLLEDDGNATHSGTMTANAVVATTSVSAASVAIAGAAVRGGLQKMPIISGGSAGDHTVTGIATTDTLIAVTYFVGAGTDVTDVSDLTGEFTIDSADTINNDSGTDTTGGKLMVTYIDVSA